MYPGNFMQHLHIHPEAGEKALGGLKGQLFCIGYCVADIIGQSAVGI